jgi:hypothetical protein
LLQGTQLLQSITAYTPEKFNAVKDTIQKKKGITSIRVTAPGLDPYTVPINVNNKSDNTKRVTAYAISNFNKKITCLTAADSCYINYLKALLTLKSAPDLIDRQLKMRQDTTAAYFSFRYPLSDSISTYENKYEVRVAPSIKDDSLNNVVKTSSFIKVARYHYFQLAAGIAYSPGAGEITSIDTSGGGFKINRDEDKARVLVGVRIYPFGLYNLKNPVGLFREWRWIHRLSIVVGTGIPKPLMNFYTGVGFDVFAGLSLSAGLHFQQRNKYDITNNQITNRRIDYKDHIFYSVTMDPGLFVKAITSFFK